MSLTHDAALFGHPCFRPHKVHKAPLCGLLIDRDGVDNEILAFLRRYNSAQVNASVEPQVLLFEPRREILPVPVVDEPLVLTSINGRLRELSNPRPDDLVTPLQRERDRISCPFLEQLLGRPVFGPRGHLFPRLRVNYEGFRLVNDHVLAAVYQVSKQVAGIRSSSNPELSSPRDHTLLEDVLKPRYLLCAVDRALGFDVVGYIVSKEEPPMTALHLALPSKHRKVGVCASQHRSGHNEFVNTPLRG